MEASVPIADLLARAANPAAAAHALDRLLDAADAATAGRIRAQPRLIQSLLVIFSHSQFLSEALIQNPDMVDWLERARRQDRVLQPEELAAELAEAAAAAPPEERALALMRWKKRELLRIALRDLSGQATLGETTLELSNLADAALAQAYAWSWNDLVARFGTPAAGMVILGLGKLGGEELNYSSDIDLMFLYTGEGQTDGAGSAGPTSNREFFIRLAQATVRYLSTPTDEGMAYRVDLRLRPAGREGELALPLARALAYYRDEARPWELQMLIKARPCAGLLKQGKIFRAQLADRIYPARGGAEAVAAVRATRELIEAHHRRRARDGINVKLDPGGIRDIEFITQGMQRRFGGGDGWLRASNTLQALQRLHDKRHLSGRQFQTLSSAYILLRQVEHRLQLRLGQQTHFLPAEPEAARPIARGLRVVPEGQGGDDAEWLQARLKQAMGQVAALFEELLPLPAAPGSGAFQLAGEDAASEASGSRRLAEYRRAIAPRLTPRGRRQLERLLVSLAGRDRAAALFGRWPEEMNARLAVFLNTSEFLIDSLSMHPGGWECLLEPMPALDERQLLLIPEEQNGAAAALAAAVLRGASDWAGRMRALRRYYHSRLCRYVAGEVLTPTGVRAALHRLTAWAEAAIAAALQIAAHAGDVPPLAVLALGRLGTREFELFSDADLLFVAREADQPHAAKLAAAIIEILASYTQEGSVFPVDARLRPEGSQGELVHTPARLADYFRQRAGLWEAVSYLKLRPIAGDLELARSAAAEIRGAIAARFGGADPRAELRAMRARLEREPRSEPRPLKTGPGGSYDFDFILSTIALGTGRLSRERGDTASEFARWAQAAAAELPAARALELSGLAAQLRAADHVIRIVTGKPARSISLPAAAAEPAGLLWSAMTGRRIEPAAFTAELEAVLERTRELYRDVMGC
ncbi:MAG TPA: hypothetical protein VE996_03115 [Terriglobales bacterium]|nr:hypothetical protein [Terriglobales bacterium]